MTARAAGFEWTDGARAVALAVSVAGAGDEARLGVRLLGNCRTVFVKLNADRVWSEDLVDALWAREEPPRSDLSNGALTEPQLAHLLRLCRVAPTGVRLSDRIAHGHLADCSVRMRVLALEPLEAVRLGGVEAPDLVCRWRWLASLIPGP